MNYNQIPNPIEKVSEVTDERLRILELIKEGNITPTEGLDLLEALGTTGTTQTYEPPQPEAGEEREAPKRKARWLYIQVDDKESNKKVNIKVPLTLAKFAGKFIPKEAKMEMAKQGIDFDLEGLMEVLQEEGEQDLVNVEDGDETVRIFIR